MAIEAPGGSSLLYGRIREILESARATAARSVNTAQVKAYWLIGREIVVDQQRGAQRAGYGERVLRLLAAKLAKEYGPGLSFRNLNYLRQFYRAFPELLGAEGIMHAPRAQSWKPGRLHASLSWTHYRALLRVEDLPRRSFYEIESVKNGWSGRELERQIASLLFERLSKSKDKSGLLGLATKGQDVLKPADVFKDPVVIEFLGLPESPRLAESKLEEALIGNLQGFLLELGKGFAFVSRQERLTLDGDHFYVDLVFYHAVLKCFVLIDLKVGKLTHQDLGQMQLYVNYFDRKRRSAGDAPTLGLILCTDKNEAVVRYTLGESQKSIFASRYKLHLPTEAELRAELRREMLGFGPQEPKLGAS